MEILILAYLILTGLTQAAPPPNILLAVADDGGLHAEADTPADDGQSQPVNVTSGITDSRNRGATPTTQSIHPPRGMHFSAERHEKATSRHCAFDDRPVTDILRPDGLCRPIYQAA